MSDRDKFDKFTERARKVLSLAQEEAQRFQHNYIGAEHLLLGLIREGEGVAAKILSHLGVELNQVRAAVESLVGRGDRIILGEIGLTSHAKKVIEQAVEEARRLTHPYIGTEHLLLGLIHGDKNTAIKILENLGINPENIRTQTVQVVSHVQVTRMASQSSTTQSSTEQAHSRDRFDKFTERARKVLTLAQEEAQRFQHNYIGTEHLLLGLVREGEGVAAQVLKNLGVELNQVRVKIEFMIGRGDRIVLGEIGLTPRAKKVIELGIDEARRLNHHYIGTEHILLGLVREGEGIAATVLNSLGVNLEKVRTQTIQVLTQGPHQFISHGKQQSAEVEKDSTPEAAPEQIAELSMLDFRLHEEDTVQPLSEEDRDFIQSGVPLGQAERERFDIFTVRARRSLRFALEEARRFQHNYIGTEHLLLGLVRENGGVAAMVLSSLGVELNKVRSAVEFIIGRGDHVGVGQIGLTPRSKKVIELAADEARRLKQDYIGTEHLLLGLVREGEGIAAGVLESLGATMQRVRAQTLLVLDHISKDNPPAQGNEEAPPT